MGANNQGINHISTRDGGLPICNNRSAHMSVSFQRWRDKQGIGSRFCARCETKARKMEAVALKRQQKA